MTQHSTYLTHGQPRRAKSRHGYSARGPSQTQCWKCTGVTSCRSAFLHTVQLPEVKHRRFHSACRIILDAFLRTFRLPRAEHDHTCMTVTHPTIPLHQSMPEIVLCLIDSRRVSGHHLASNSGRKHTHCLLHVLISSKKDVRESFCTL